MCGSVKFREARQTWLQNSRGNSYVEVQFDTENYSKFSCRCMQQLASLLFDCSISVPVLWEAAFFLPRMNTVH